MKRIVRLTESDLTRIVRRVIMEQATATGTDVGKFSWAFDPDKIMTSEFVIGDKVEGGFFIVSKTNKNIKIRISCDNRPTAMVYFGDTPKGDMYKYNKGMVGTTNPATGVRSYCSKMK